MVMAVRIANFGFRITEWGKILVSSICTVEKKKK